ncbi:MAG TPA: hypothetical protein VF792_02865 [Ktedonobacterales bacterium]
MRLYTGMQAGRRIAPPEPVAQSARRIQRWQTMSKTQRDQRRAAPRAESQRAEDTQVSVITAPQASESFSPGEPIRPTPGLSGPGGAPRQWSFPVGYNIAQYPRATEQTSFAQLRSLAALYDGAQLCERVYFNMLGRLELHITLRTEAIAEGEHATSPQMREAARRIEGFLESPDRSQDLRAWLVAFVRDLLEIDAVAVYTRRTRGGDLYALELVAGECYTESMEILTDSGWKRFPDVDLERDRFATRHQQTHAFEWQKATYFHKAEWDSVSMCPGTCGLW